MDSSSRINAAVMQIVDTQIRDLEPPATKQTYDRLMAEGHDEQEARRLIACVVVSEVYDILKQGKPFEPERYAAALGRLPKVPWEE